MKITSPSSPTLYGFPARTVSLLALLFAGIAGYSCSDNHPAGSGEPAADGISFHSTITGHGKTRAVDSQWEENDEIGIFVFDNISSGELGANHRYFTTGGGTFTAASPADWVRLSEGDLVDFIAYYPYTDAIVDHIYNVDLADQSDQDEIDLLYSDNARGVGPDNPLVSLSFDHRLTKIVLEITNSGEGDLSGLRVKLKGMKTRGKFDLLTGDLTQEAGSEADLDMWVTTTTEGRRAEAIVMPTADVSGIEFEFILGDETFRWDYPLDKTLEKGTKHTYALSLNSSAPPVAEPQYGWVELPETRVMPNTYTVTHMMSEKERNYTLFYDGNYKISYWVAYPLVPAHTTGVARKDDWAYDPLVPTQYQANLKLGSYDHSQRDRGHQIPSADRVITRTANAQTFYSTNMTPQNSTLNQQGWAKLETQVRNWCSNCDTLYVLTGAILPSNENSIVYINDKAGLPVAEPEYYYKVLARRTGGEAAPIYQTVGFKFDNVSTGNGINLDNYKLTVKELEEMTGFTFFPSLAEELKTNTSTTGW